MPWWSLARQDARAKPEVATKNLGAPVLLRSPAWLPRFAVGLAMFALLAVATGCGAAGSGSSSEDPWTELYAPHANGIRNPANSVPGLAGGLGIAFTDAMHGWLTVGAGHTWQSSNGGRTWRLATGRIVGDRRCGPVTLPLRVGDVPGAGAPALHEPGRPLACL